MKIFSCDGGPAARPTVVLVFGSGMIGGSIQTELSRNGYRALSLHYDWDDERARRGVVPSIISMTEDLVRPGSGSPPGDQRRVEIVWAAGKAGFQATEREMNSEIEVFEETMASLFLPLARRTSAAFHLFSSAGGAYEGSGLVRSTTSPSPRRPYGTAKLRMEAAAAECAGSFRSIVIYRPSTVYGPVAPGARVGLINRIIENTLAGRTTTFFARPDTLRDYVFSRDIARYVCRFQTRPAPGPHFDILASGKPTNLSEVRSVCESVLGRPVLVSYSADVSNATNITFSRRTRPLGLTITDFEQGVRATARAIAGTSFSTGPCRRPPTRASGGARS